MALFLFADLTGVYFGLLLGLGQVLGLLELSALHLVFGHLLIVLELDLSVQLLPIGPFVHSSYLSLHHLLLEIRVLDSFYYMVPVLYL